MAEKQYYAAIDLGTTNSVFAHANIINDRMKPIVLELDRKSETGSTSRSPLLPSVVFYYKNNEGDMVNDVGDYAKSRYGTRAGYVCKSVKSLMGRKPEVDLVDEIQDRTPADISGQILSYILNGAKKRLFLKDLRDVVITVPASFDSDQCQATRDAAEKAGINIENVHDILLYEPKAVIYDFMRMQEDGEIPSDILSLDTAKNIMVFDLGGGTLDVTLHKVEYSDEKILNIDDIAISRFTLLGGDNFDELIAADMLKRFEAAYDIKVSIKRKEEVMSKLRKQAERLKIDLSQTYMNAAMADVELPDDYELEECMDVNLYDSYSFVETYTKAEVEEIVAPLLGYEYSIKDVGRIQKMDEKDVDNIIYPILDVLDKAGPNVKIDAVILNGGMTKSYMIQKRLTEFFGFAPLQTSDPDLSVARGAVYYHYCLHKYNIQKTVNPITSALEDRQKAADAPKPVFNTGTILNDSINLGLRGEYVSLLIPAGTKLPYHSEEIRDMYKLNKTTNTLGIELYLGRSTTKNLPNRRIATRTVKFAASYAANTPISFQIYIDALRMMTMEAWITGHPETKTIMEMDVASLKGAKKSTKDISTIGKLKLNAKSEMNTLRDMANRNKNRSGHELNETISNLIDSIGQASNPEDFFEPCMELVNNCNQSDVLLGYIYAVAIGFKDGWTDAQKKRISDVAKRHFSSYSFSVKQNGYVLRKALELIANTDPDFVAFYSKYLTDFTVENHAIKQAMCQFVTLYEEDDAVLAKFFEKHFKVSDLNVWIAKHLITRYGREARKDNHRKLIKLIKNLVSGLNARDREGISKYLVVLIAELFSNDTPNPIHDDKHVAKPAWQGVKRYLDEEEDLNFVSAVTSIWNGVSLTEEEEETISKAMKEA